MKDGETDVLLAQPASSLHSSRLLGSASVESRRGASQISRSYKQASHFFLQRRFPEALLTVQPLITSQRRRNISNEESTNSVITPIAGASRSNRVKVWSLYLTLLNAIVELGAEEGKHIFGNAPWRAIWTKVRDGSIWAEVVKMGYGGQEGNVDTEVVSNLATLLITHAPTQKITQQRLENYLAASYIPNLDFTGRFDAVIDKNALQSRAARGSGTDTPRDLGAKVKVIELYSLHVLPRNGEWIYAKEFLTMSEVLDEDTREEFLQTLDSLEAQSQLDEERSLELQRQQEMEQARARQEAERIASEETQSKEREKGREYHGSNGIREPSGSEKDYGIEDFGSSKIPHNSTDAKPTPSTNRQRSLPQPKDFSKRKISGSGFFGRSAALISTLQHLILRMTRSMSRSPAAMLRLIIFMVALLVALGRHDVRNVLARVTVAVRRTIGMGVKVSYI